MNFFKKKDFYEIRDIGRTSGLEKTLTAFDLVLLGLGAIVGTGVFVLTGAVAAKNAGPAITISFAIAGCTGIFVAFVYTELASMLPTSGSVYTYSYVAFGEVFAWLIGSVMIIELGFAASTVAAGWSAYLQGMLALGDIHIPDYLTNVPSNGGIINLPAMLIVLFVGFVLYLGTKDSKKLNNILVFVKMMVIFIFMLTAVPHVDLENWEVFMPFGTDKVLYGASTLFFAFTGFGILASAAEECKNPKKDLTVGIIGSLVLSTIIYIIVGALLTLIVHYSVLDSAQPMALALQMNGSNIGSAIVATGALAGMTTVMMMNIYALSRIFYVIGRDRLLPRIMSKLHPKYNTPYVTLGCIVLFVSVLAAFCPYETLGKLSSMAALIDYIAVALAVMIFRVTFKDVERPFKCPAVFFVAPTALIASVILLLQLFVDVTEFFDTGALNLLLTGKIIILWFAVMFALYVIRVMFFTKKEEHMH